MDANQDLSEQHRVWEEWAQADPLWAILSDPSRKGGRWELSEFFASGEKDIDNALSQVAERGLSPAHSRCLDFGCGVGRLSQALARVFDHCDGVDISETMVHLARKYNRFGDHCQYHVNVEPDLALFDSNTFDFVYSTIVLQHNPPATAERYIEEFCRVLSPGGVAVFDMTASLNVQHLPQDSHHAELKLAAPVPPLRAGEPSIVDVIVTNSSGLDWPAGCWLAAGNHWVLSEEGKVAVQDDGRTVMHEGLAAGQSLSVQLVIKAPAAPGPYTLVIDLVEERVSWFADRGSVPVAVDVAVRRPPSTLLKKLRSRGGSEPTASEPAPFSMNGLPRDRVEDAVVRAGCSIADVLPSVSGGHHWDGYRYFVAKA